MTEFSFLENLPSIIFILAFSSIFVIFIFGGFLLLTTGSDTERIERGRRMLLNSLYALFITLLVAFVFFLITYLLRGGEALKPSEDVGEFPPSPLTSFPPSPQFFKIGDYYFSDPISLQSLEETDSSFSRNLQGLYAILCKKNGEYDIMYIGAPGERSPGHECWIENCNQRYENLYISIFLTSSDAKEIKDKLNFQVNPLCLSAE